MTNNSLYPLSLLIAILLVFPAASSCFAETETSAVPAAGIYVSETFGSVEAAYQGKDNRLVIHIQDAHTDAKAQESITAILERLSDNYGIDSVWIEGADGVVDTSLFASFPANKTKEALSKYYRDNGTIGGPEYYSVNSVKPVHLFGAEDSKVYFENVGAFKEVWGNRKVVVAALGEMRRNLELLKNKVYTAELKALDGKRTAFERGELSFTAYCEFLKSESEKNGIDVKKFGDLGLLFEMFAMEKGIDFAKVETERAELVKRLVPGLGKEKLTELTRVSLNFRLGRIPPADFYGLLNSTAVSANVGMENFKDLAAYAKYLDLSERVNRARAHGEMEDLENELLSKLCVSAGAAEIKDLSGNFKVMEKFVTLKISRKDFDFYVKHSDACSPKRLSEGIKTGLSKNGISAAAGDVVEVLSPAVEKASRFYDIALKRDNEMASRLLAGMTGIGREKAVLVTGGFHTEGITRILRENGISYVVILPKVGTKYNEEKYVSLLLNDKTPFLDYFKKKERTDALPGSIGMAEVNERAEAALALHAVSGTDNFSDELISALPVIAVAVKEMKEAGASGVWLAAEGERVKTALDIERGVFKKSVEKLGEVTLYPGLELSNNEAYFPVKIGDRTIVMKFFKGAENADDFLPPDRLVGAPFVFADFTVQACDEAGFADAMIQKNVPGAQNYIDTLSPEMRDACSRALADKTGSSALERELSTAAAVDSGA